MPTDPGYQAQPPAPKRSAAREPSVRDPADVQMRRPPWTSDRFFMVAISEAMGLIAVLAAMLVLVPDYTSLLWTHPLGIKLLLGSIVLLAINFAGLFGAATFLNRRTSSPQTGSRLAIVVVLGLLLYLPVLFVVVVGPFVIAIVEKLR